MFLGLTGLAVLLFSGLCGWQIERRSWKLALITAVDRRVSATPMSPPPPSLWSKLTRDRDEYHHVVIAGMLLNAHATLVSALTDYGAGYWVLTPMRTAAGFTVLINRGFVPDRLRAGAPDAPATAAVRVTGLLRLTEPHGRFLRANRPDQDRWYSRDVAAIARRQGLRDVAPYFIDADATPNPGGWPRGGLTVIAFPNNHLVYAITWLGLALLSAAGFVLVWRERREPSAE